MFEFKVMFSSNARHTLLIIFELHANSLAYTIFAIRKRKKKSRQDTRMDFPFSSFLLSFGSRRLWPACSLCCCREPHLLYIYSPILLSWQFAFFFFCTRERCPEPRLYYIYIWEILRWKYIIYCMQTATVADGEILIDDLELMYMYIFVCVCTHRISWKVSMYVCARFLALPAV